MSETAIVLVNYNAPDDTIECVASLLNLRNQDFKIIIVDNDSTKENRNRLINWLEGKFSATFSTPEKINSLTLGQEKFSGEFFLLNHNIENGFEMPVDEQTFVNKKIILVHNNANSGFAAANNIGMKISLALNCKYSWLLNNDAVADTEALNGLISYHKQISGEKKIGLIGCKVLFYSQPEIIQAVGDRFNVYTTWSYHLGLNEIDNGQYDNGNFQFDYPYGASLLFSNDFVRDCGMMNEQYFLYFEEADWTLRGRKNNYEPAACMTAKIFHKQGVTTGKKIRKEKPAWIASLMYGNLLLFYKNYYPQLVWIAWLRLFLKAVKNIFTGNILEAFLILKIIFGIHRPNRKAIRVSEKT